MKEYTVKEMKLLSANPYTLKVTRNRLYFTTEFKEAFWLGYQAGKAPRKLLSDLGYDLEIFGQKQINSIVQSIKRQAQSGYGFTQGISRNRRIKDNVLHLGNNEENYQISMERILNEVKYLRQEVEFLKKIIQVNNNRKVKKV